MVAGLVLILVGSGHKTSLEHKGDGFGRLMQPRDYARAADTAHSGIPWAADNDAFGGWNDERATRYRKMLDTIYGLPGCRFVTSPDVVGDHNATLELWHEWRSELVAAWLPIAFVLQDGATTDTIPWEGCDAVFVGGTTEFKLGAEAERLVREARLRGKWIHMGRVNSRKRFDYARQIGCHSVDGSSFSRWRNTWLPNALKWHRDHLQERMPA
jgi:hypothetical protein